MAYAFFVWYTLSRTPAQVAKLVDALALGASEATHGGSSPLLGTNSWPKHEYVLAIAICSPGEDLKDCFGVP